MAISKTLTLDSSGGSFALGKIKMARGLSHSCPFTYAQMMSYKSSTSRRVALLHRMSNSSMLVKISSALTKKQLSSICKDLGCEPGIPLLSTSGWHLVPPSSLYLMGLSLGAMLTVYGKSKKSRATSVTDSTWVYTTIRKNSNQMSLATIKSLGKPNCPKSLPSPKMQLGQRVLLRRTRW